MVYNKTKWVCGLGETTFFYCSVCNTPYNKFDAAYNCEINHYEVMTK